VTKIKKKRKKRFYIYGMHERDRWTDQATVAFVAMPPNNTKYKVYDAVRESSCGSYSWMQKNLRAKLTESPQGRIYMCIDSRPLELHLAISELWFGQEWEGILLELLCSSSIV